MRITESRIDALRWAAGQGWGRPRAKTLGALHSAGLLSLRGGCKYEITPTGRLVLHAFELGVRIYERLPREPFDDLDQGP